MLTTHLSILEFQIFFFFTAPNFFHTFFTPVKYIKTIPDSSPAPITYSTRLAEMATLSRSNSWTRLSDKAAPETVCRTPLPWRELTVVLLVLTTESIAFQYLFPFVPFMVRGFGIVEEDVVFYSGWIASAFMVGQFFSSLFWGRLSDIIGLKPVMLTGMFFTAVTVFLFGFSKSLEWALACRFVGGLFNGVIGVTKTYIGLITDETNEAQAVRLCAPLPAH